MHSSSHILVIPALRGTLTLNKKTENENTNGTK